MAKIVVENATVERVFETRTGSVGVSLKESYTPKNGGEVRHSWFTAWFDRHPQVEVGQVVSVSGFHSARTRTYDSASGPKTSVDVSVNSARLIDSAPPIAPAPSDGSDLAYPDEVPPEDPYASGGDLGW